MSPAADERRLARLAADLGLELPPFKGPLDAFEIDAAHDPAGSVFLGGDLHAIHPDAIDQRSGRERDRALDSATINVVNHEQAALAVTAVEGIWCMRITAELLDAAPQFTLFGSDARLRTWLLLPPVRQMIGIGHLWLPSVPPVASHRQG